jgi:drug/metabolite transporter (DMT)-like permease
MGRGVCWSLISSFFWGTTFVCARYLLADRSVDPLTLACLRFVLGGTIMLLCGWVWRRSGLLKIRLKDFARCAGLALMSIVGMCLFLFTGQQYTSASNSSVIMSTNPVFFALLGVLIGERIRLINLGGIIISMTGMLMVMNVLTMHGFHFFLNEGKYGDLLVLASAFCWALGSVLSKPTVEKIGGYATTTWTIVSGALELVVLRLILPMKMVWPETAGQWAAVFYIGTFPTAVAFFGWYEAMRLIRLSLLNIMQYLTPVFSLLLAWMLLGEHMSPWQLSGIAVVLSGITLVSWRSQLKQS